MFSSYLDMSLTIYNTLFGVYISYGVCFIQKMKNVLIKTEEVNCSYFYHQYEDEEDCYLGAVHI